MDFSRLDRNRVLLGALGGGRAADQPPLPALVLAHRHPASGRNRTPGSAARATSSCTGFETFPILRWLLLAGAFAPLILAWILVRGHKLSWAPGELTMVVGFAAITLIGYNGIIDRPAPDNGTEFGIGLDYGYWLALLAAIAIAATGFLRSQVGQKRGAQGPRHGLSREAWPWRPSQTGVISHDVRSGTRPDRNLALELVRVTEAAALAAARWVGRGEKEAADQAAVDAMRLMLDTVPMDGVVVIGEGEKDEAPMLYNGERIGDGSPPEVDIAVDPLEGTRLTAQGQPSALAVIALVGARDDVRPRPLRLHGEDRRRPRDRRLPEPDRPARRRGPAGRRAQAGRGRRRHRDHARPSPPRGRP